MRNKAAFWLILALALILRLGYGLAQDHAAPYRDASGDMSWYLANGYALASGRDNTSLDGFGASGSYPVELAKLPTPPLYLLFVGLPQTILPPTTALIVIRVLQALLSTATIYCAYRLARFIAWNNKAGLIVALVLALHPAFIIEAANIASETLYIFLLTAALAIYVEYVASLEDDLSTGKAILAAAALLGLATLTRAVLLLFPLGLAIHLLLVYRRRSPGLILRLLLVYALVVGSWTAYSKLRWDRWVIAGEGFSAFLFIGATEAGWEGPDALDQALEDADVGGEDRYLDAAGAIIGSDPLGYMQRRLLRLAEAQIQPHGTLFFRGPPLRFLTVDWLRGRRSLDSVVQSLGFWPKLSLYLLQAIAYGAGLIGIWRTRRRWPLTLPLIGLIVYVALLHLVLEALPRYIFPTAVFWWVFAACAFVRLRPSDETS